MKGMLHLECCRYVFGDRFTTKLVRAVENTDGNLVLSLTNPDKAEMVIYPVNGGLGAPYVCEGI